ncbi:MAG: sugar transferase [Clostridium sp.]|nr:sugar transferase [Clostridium sp.]
MNIINKFFKRFFDIIVSLIGIIILGIFLIIISIIIKCTSEGPVFFKQIRVGQSGKEFKIFKFRTMVVNAESLGTQITIGKDKRITKIGHFLRKYKIDELPQLFNVFIGEMSFVGPRPEVPKYVAMYNETQREVLSVRPGITDLASIRYRNENEILGRAKNADEAEDMYINEIMPDKLKLNLEYIEKSNVFYDIYIIFKTIIICL